MSLDERLSPPSAASASSSELDEDVVDSLSSVFFVYSSVAASALLSFVSSAVSDLSSPSLSAVAVSLKPALVSSAGVVSSGVFFLPKKPRVGVLEKISVLYLKDAEFISA